jgi:hypothetical protein
LADGPSWLPDAALTRVLELMAEAVAGSRAALTYVRQNFGVGSDLAASVGRKSEEAGQEFGGACPIGQVAGRGGGLVVLG